MTSNFIRCLKGNTARCPEAYERLMEELKAYFYLLERVCGDLCISRTGNISQHIMPIN